MSLMFSSLKYSINLNISILLFWASKHIDCEPIFLLNLFFTSRKNSSTGARDWEYAGKYIIWRLSNLYSLVVSLDQWIEALSSVRM